MTGYRTIKDVSIQLGISRDTLRFYLREYGIEVKRFPFDRNHYIPLTDAQQLLDMREHPEKYAVTVTPTERRGRKPALGPKPSIEAAIA